MPRMDKVKGVATSVTTEGNTTRVRYHSTDVVTITPERIVLDTGGWRTATTKTRMNQAAYQFGFNYAVVQRKGEWYVQSRVLRHFELPFDKSTFVIERV